jgi:hypothetical protein
MEVKHGQQWDRRPLSHLFLTSMFFPKSPFKTYFLGNKGINIFQMRVRQFKLHSKEKIQTTWQLPGLTNYVDPSKKEILQGSGLASTEKF